MHARTHVCVCVCVLPLAFMCARMFFCLSFVCVFVCVFVCACGHGYTSVCVFVCVGVCVCVYVNMYACVCMCVDRYVYISVRRVCLCVCKYICKLLCRLTVDVRSSAGSCGRTLLHRQHRHVLPYVGREDVPLLLRGRAGAGVSSATSSFGADGGASRWAHLRQGSPWRAVVYIHTYVGVAMCTYTCVYRDGWTSVCKPTCFCFHTYVCM